METILGIIIIKMQATQAGAYYDIRIPSFVSFFEGLLAFNGRIKACIVVLGLLCWRVVFNCL